MLVGLAINALLLRPALSALGLTENTARAIRFGVNAGIILVTYWWLFRAYEGRMIEELSPRYALKEGVAGWLSGALTIASVVLSLHLLGSCQIYATGRSAVLLLYPVVYQGFIGTLEEVLFRGILYRIAAQYLGPPVAAVASASLFAVFHLSNEGANVATLLFVAVWGIALAMMFSLTGRLWFPIFFHSGWNSAMVILGTLVSGMDEFRGYALLRTEMQGPAWLTGGVFGPENSVITLALTALLAGALCAIASKRGCAQVSYDAGACSL
jgi:membrane protease YdiL (CAAX protease family)